MSTISIRVAIVEDHLLVRESVQHLLNSHEEFTVCWSGDSPDQLLAEWPNVEVALLDLELHGELISIKAVQAIIASGARVIVVTANAEPAIIRELVFTGVHAVISKTESSEVVIDAALRVGRGEELTTRELASALVNAQPAEIPKLSAQEQRVLQLYASGLKIDAVANQLQVSPNTVKGYLKRLRRKLTEVGRPASTQRDLYIEARRQGMVDS